MSRTVTFAELLEMSAYRAPIETGRHTVTVEEVVASGERLRARVRTDDGAESWVPLGSGRTLGRRLRVLLGDAEGLDGLQAVREALVGRRFRVRLDLREYQGATYLELRRA